MTTETREIIQRLKCCVEKSGLTYVELEKVTGIAKSSLQRYVSGTTKKIPIESIKSIANAVGVSPAYIMGWDEENKKTKPTFSLSDEDVFSSLKVSDNSSSIKNLPSTFTHKEKKLLDNYKSLNNVGKEKLLDYADDLVVNDKYKNENK